MDMKAFQTWLASLPKTPDENTPEMGASMLKLVVDAINTGTHANQQGEVTTHQIFMSIKLARIYSAISSAMVSMGCQEYSEMAHGDYHDAAAMIKGAQIPYEPVSAEREIKQRFGRI